ncbi:ESX secretion-associated protein EspG [Nocardioides antri]|uniref:ESX secretion-associated protein EspG n=1 Tax=Nocardioides antri TaxID=2607659 RepID=A0A5B1M3B3_9ACTN|nr:ESX secretion-associated protein EspG [Nocardioides antri]KAA1427221.1 hypothetical protein F0U47_06870 [Nocardioides antri]
MIRIGERAPLARPRRLALGVDKWMALQQAAEATGLTLPKDLRVILDPIDAAVAGLDVEAGLDAAADQLRRHGVLDDDGPVPAVAANLAALGSAARRVRTSVAGPGLHRLGYYWADARLGGSLVRDGFTHTLSLYDARSLGDELLALVPAPEGEARGREPFAAPLDAVGPVAALDEVPDAVARALGEFVDMPADDVARLRERVESNRAVLHVTAVGPGRPPYALVWFLSRDGWWAGATRRRSDGVRMLTLTPRRREELRTDLAGLMTGAWL